MLRLLTLVLSILLSACSAQAEPWVCFDPITKRVVKVVLGDGVQLGISGPNNTNIDPNCILATQIEYDNAKKSFYKVDINLSIGNRVIKLSQAEKDSIVLAQNNANDLSTREDAKDSFDGKTIESLKLKALVSVLVDEINVLRSQHSLAPRTLGQAKTAIKNKITNGDVDAD